MVPRWVGASPKRSSIAGGVGGGGGGSGVEEDDFAAVHASSIFNTVDGMGGWFPEIVNFVEIGEGGDGLFADRGGRFWTVVLMEVVEGCWFSEDSVSGLRPPFLFWIEVAKVYVRGNLLGSDVR